MSPNHLYLPLGELFSMLTDTGFTVDVGTHIKVLRYANAAAASSPKSLIKLKFQLAAILCRDAVQQERFYPIFENFIRPFIVAAPGTDNPDPGGAHLNETSTQTAMPGSHGWNTPGTTTAKPGKTSGKSGPMRIELRFPANNFRAWNTRETDLAVRPLREKEWTEVQEWDIPASIRRTIRSGGIPQFVLRRRKRAPQYLLLIDQKSPRDHLASLYADFILELHRRDLNAEYYFYDFIPYRCWRDPRDPQSYTTVDALQSYYAGYKLLLVGDADGLLALPYLMPSNLAIELHESWSEVALLAPKSTADWGDAELALCPLFPVVPANAAGLTTLVQQWNATEFFTPAYWKMVYPEPAPPVQGSGLDAPSKEILESLYYYLGENGFQWLCAAAVYPEIYWELTKLFHDDSMDSDRQLNEWDQNQGWQVSLLRMSRIPWMRQGSIPTPERTLLRQYFETELSLKQRQTIRQKLIEVLGMAENQPPPNSYAAANHAFTIAWYEYEQRMTQPNLSEFEKEKIESEFREKGLDKIQLSEIEDAIGRQLWAKALGGQVEEVEQAILSGTFLADSLEVRSGPSISSPVVDEIRGRAPISIFETSSDGDWYRIGENRWVSAKFMEIEQAPASPFRILWVDDNPENNSKERALLKERFGVSFAISANTDDALRQLATQHFDLVISDAVRGDDHEAGMKLLQTMQDRRYVVPFVVYTSATNFDYFKDVFEKAGAVGVFRGEDDLTDFVRGWLKGKAEGADYGEKEKSYSIGSLIEKYIYERRLGAIFYILEKYKVSGINKLKKQCLDRIKQLIRGEISFNDWAAFYESFQSSILNLAKANKIRNILINENIYEDNIEIRQLISNAETEKALDFMLQHNRRGSLILTNEIILLRGQYMIGKNANLSGEINFEQWHQMQSQINNLILLISGFETQ